MKNTEKKRRLTIEINEQSFQLLEALAVSLLMQKSELYEYDLNKTQSLLVKGMDKKKETFSPLVRELTEKIIDSLSDGVAARRTSWEGEVVTSLTGWDGNLYPSMFGNLLNAEEMGLSN